MIYTLDGTPLGEALHMAALRLANRVPDHVRKPVPQLVPGSPYTGLTRSGVLRRDVTLRRAFPFPGRYKPKYDGDQLREIRGRHGVGRPNYHPRIVRATTQQALAAIEFVVPPTYNAALHEYGSQRAAARALGIALSTFQRRLAKEAAGS